MKAKMKIAIWLIILALCGATLANAQSPPVPPALFDITGFIQEATLLRQGAPKDPILFGGTMTVNGHKIIIPDNTIVQMPAAAFTWAQLFDPAVSASVGFFPARPNHPAGQTGLALRDAPAGAPVGTVGGQAFPSFQARVVGNIVPNAATGVPKYIAGLIVPITQDGLNVGAGIINYINYSTGMFKVGGKIGDPNTGSWVQINDPVGRFTKKRSPDPRFSADTSNPTICAESGYPVGIPRVPPPNIDPLCPITNRPLNGDPNFPTDPFLAANAPLRTFNMPAPGPGVTPDATQQVPLMVGDFVEYSGTVYKINPAGPALPFNLFTSAHTLLADLGIFTAPGIQPCYVRVEAFLVPTTAVKNAPITTAGTPPTVVASENSLRVHIVGFTTDPTNLIDLAAIDVDPTSGVEAERIFATVLPEPIGVGLVRGRFRLQSANFPGTFPATREYIAKSRTGQTVAANGLTVGQYRLPCFDYLFAERTVFGNPTIPANFNAMPFLAKGCGPLNGTGPVVGPLDPWPQPDIPGVTTLSEPAPAAAAAAPIVVKSADMPDISAPSSSRRPSSKR